MSSRTMHHGAAIFPKTRASYWPNITLVLKHSHYILQNKNRIRQWCTNRGPRSYFHWKENLTLQSFFREFLLRLFIIVARGGFVKDKCEMWPTSQKVWAPLVYAN